MLRGRKIVRADCRSCTKPAQAVVAFIQNRVFYTDALFIRIENTAGARERAMAATSASAHVGGYRRTVALELARTASRPRGSSIADGREAVRPQSTIVEKNNSKPLLPLIAPKPQAVRTGPAGDRAEAGFFSRPQWSWCGYPLRTG